jgi:hypothetical protein
MMVVSLGGIFVRAASLSTSISGNNSIDMGSEITLTFFLDVDEPVKQLTAKLNVDLSLLDIVGSPTALNGLNVQLDDNIITVSSAEGVSGSISFMRMTFKAKETLSADSQTIVSLSDVSGILFESDETVSGTGSTKLITAVAPKSNNNFLSDLYTNEGDIGFSRSTLVYSLTVDNDVSRIRIVAKAEHEKATVREDAIYDLAVYQNKIDVVVTAQNGAKRTYTINVMRKDALGNTKLMSSNVELKSLAIEGYDIEFSPSVVEYRLTVGNIVDNVLVYAEASDSKSSVIIDNLPLLKLGENRVQVTVVAENGQSRIYTIFVTRSLEAPVIDLEDLDEYVYQTTATVLPILLNGSRWLSAGVLDKVRRAAKILDISKLDEKGMLLYRWTIDGRSLSAGTSIDLNIRFDSTYMDQMEELLNSPNFKVIGFSHQGELPVGTMVRVYIGNMFSNLATLNLYRYDTESKTLELNSQSLRADNGYVEFEVLLAGEYVVSDVEIQPKHPLDFVLFIALAFIVLIIAALVWLLINRNRMNIKTMA